MFARHNGNLKYEKMVDSEKINCCVYATVENHGEKAINLSDFDVKLVCDGKEYEQFLIYGSLTVKTTRSQRKFPTVRSLTGNICTMITETRMVLRIMTRFYVRSDLMGLTIKK